MRLREISLPRRCQLPSNHHLRWVRPSPALDTLRGPVYEGDLFLLCSDGLTDLVDDSEINTVLGLEADLALKTEHLIDLAKSAGGKDNITVVLAQVIEA